MSSFSQVAPEVHVPSRTLVLKPSSFASTWPKAPRKDVCVGLRLLSSADVETAKSSAALEAWTLLPRPEDVVARETMCEELIVRWLVARGTCSPNDVLRPCELWKEAPEDMVREALSREGVKAIWDAIDLLAVETSPVLREADDDDILELAALAPEALEAMPERKARRVRRLLAYCLDELRDAEPQSP